MSDACPASAGALDRQSEGDVPADRRVTDGLEEVRRLVARRQFRQAVGACLPLLAGPKCAVELLRDASSSWEEAVLEEARAREGERAALEAELGEACATLAAWQQLLADREAALMAEAHKREVAERQVLEMEADVKRCVMELRLARERLAEQDRQLLAESKRSMDAREEGAQQLRQALGELQQLRLRLQDGACRPVGFEHVARHVAELEGSPLRRCDEPGRQALKRRLLMKWHPDKQPSTEHAALATQVLQELQNRPEWPQG